ncbi:hypothetical protein INR49_022756 [Caranx melampygus]|nr:hypothetical protein INR49_022756 [Caranx melampygus]
MTVNVLLSHRDIADVDPDRLHHIRLTLGDGGAALFCSKSGAYFLSGVVTWGSRHCDASRPGVFTRVSDYSSWISQVTEDN